MIGCVVVQGLDRLSDPDLEAVGVGHLDVAPAAEAAVVVDRRAPGVAGGGRLLLRRAGALLAAGDLDDQRPLDVGFVVLDQPDEEVGDVGVASPLVDIRDREAEVVVLDVGVDVLVQLEFAGQELLPGVAVLAVEGDVRDLGLLGR